MKKILASIFLMVLSLLMIGCVTIYEYASLSVLTKDENFNSAYVEVEMLDVKPIIDYNDLKEQNFYKNIMNSATEPTDVLPEVIPTWSLIISSDESILQFDNLGSLYAKYNEKWYKIKCATNDLVALNNYLPINHSCEEDHKWDEGVIYEVPGSMDKELIQTCLRCGETKSTIVEKGVKYKLTLVGDTDLLMESISEEYHPGFMIEIKTHVLFDADIEIYANGEKLKKTHYDSDYWGYTLEMPNQDVTIEIKVVDGWKVNPYINLEVTTYVENDNYDYEGVIKCRGFQSFADFCQEYFLEKNYYVIDNYDKWMSIYTNLTGREIEPIPGEVAEELYQERVQLLIKREANASNYIKVSYQFDFVNNKLIVSFPYEDSLGDEAIFTCIDMVEVPRELLPYVLETFMLKADEK